MDDTVRPAQGDEEAFVERLRALDHRAWADLYDLHHARIWRYVYARTADRDASDDLAAQVFTEALSAIRRYRHTGPPVLAWLYRIARNLAAAHRRRRRRDAPQAIEPSGGSLEERLDAMDLANALDRLTKDQREVVALRFFAGYSTREIAAALSKSETAIYSLEVRAIGSLRRLLLDSGRNLTKGADEFGRVADIDTAI